MSSYAFTDEAKREMQQTLVTDELSPNGVSRQERATADADIVAMLQDPALTPGKEQALREEQREIDSEPGKVKSTLPNAKPSESSDDSPNNAVTPPATFSASAAQIAGLTAAFGLSPSAAAATATIANSLLKLMVAQSYKAEDVMQSDTTSIASSMSMSGASPADAATDALDPGKTKANQPAVTGRTGATEDKALALEKEKYAAGLALDDKITQADAFATADIRTGVGEQVGKMNKTEVEYAKYKPAETAAKLTDNVPGDTQETEKKLAPANAPPPLPTSLVIGHGDGGHSGTLPGQNIGTGKSSGQSAALHA